MISDAWVGITGSPLNPLTGRGSQVPEARPPNRVWKTPRASFPETCGDHGPYPGPVLVGPGLKANCGLPRCHCCSLSSEPWRSRSGMTHSPPFLAERRPGGHPRQTSPPAAALDPWETRGLLVARALIASFHRPIQGLCFGPGTLADAESHVSSGQPRNHRQVAF